MAPTPKRIPGEPNPVVDGTEVFHLQNAASASGGASAGDCGAGALFSAWARWRLRRRKKTAMAAVQAQRDAAQNP